MPSEEELREELAETLQEQKRLMSKIMNLKADIRAAEKWQDNDSPESELTDGVCV